MWIHEFRCAKKKERSRQSNFVICECWNQEEREKEKTKEKKIEELDIGKVLTEYTLLRGR